MSSHAINQICWLVGQISKEQFKKLEKKLNEAIWESVCIACFKLRRILNSKRKFNTLTPDQVIQEIIDCNVILNCAIFHYSHS
jgi:hypothetical protein